MDWLDLLAKPRIFMQRRALPLGQKIHKPWPHPFHVCFFFFILEHAAWIISVIDTSRKIMIFTWTRRVITNFPFTLIFASCTTSIRKETVQTTVSRGRAVTETSSFMTPSSTGGGARTKVIPFSPIAIDCKKSKQKNCFIFIETCY